MKLQAIILALTLLGTAPGSADPGTAYLLQDRREVWRIFDVDPDFAESIVWPEIERFWAPFDFVETSVNYITSSFGGKDIELSIGVFQMKPSFVEKLEKAWTDSRFADYYQLRFDTSDNAETRSKRIDRMSTEEWQVIYLAMFVRMMYSSYGSFNEAGERIRDGIDTYPLEEQLRMCANAYNRGCPWTEAGCGDIERIRYKMYAEVFPRALSHASLKLQCYTTIAWEHYLSVTDQR